MSEKLTFIVPMEYDNSKALHFLKRSCGLSTRMITLLKREKNGILMDGKILRTIDKVYFGKTIEINLPNESPSFIEPVEGALDILYEDGHILAVNKPPFMPVHPVKQHQTDTLSNVIAFYLREKGSSFVFRAVNRLDRNTSGIVIVAKNKFCANALKNKVEKSYHALCHGLLDGEGTIDRPIGLKSGSKIVRAVTKDGAPSVTHYQSMAHTSSTTLVKLWLETGRTHQIRCHMAHMGHPLLGDDLYGGSKELINRQALHCSEASFIHPVTAKRITLSAEIPKDFKEALDKSFIKRACQ